MVRPLRPVSWQQLGTSSQPYFRSYPISTIQQVTRLPRPDHKLPKWLILLHGITAEDLFEASELWICIRAIVFSISLEGIFILLVMVFLFQYLKQPLRKRVRLGCVWCSSQKRRKATSKALSHNQKGQLDTQRPLQIAVRTTQVDEIIAYKILFLSFGLFFWTADDCQPGPCSTSILDGGAYSWTHGQCSPCI